MASTAGRRASVRKGSLEDKDKDREKDKDKDKSKEKDKSGSADEVSISKTLSLIHSDIKEVKVDLKKTVKREELESLVTNIVKNLIDANNKEREKVINAEVDKRCSEIERKCAERVEKVESKLDRVEAEVVHMQETIGDKNAKIRELEKRVMENEIDTKKAVNRSNHNEQYSRKTNFKILGVEEEDGENAQTTMKDTVSSLAGVKLSDDEIMACHRIPGQSGKPRPILIKLRNAEVKSRVMRTRSIVKKKGQAKGIRFVDDVTRDNADLITKLLAHDKIESAWYFNGEVYAKPHGKKRMLFTLTDKDDIESKLKNAVPDSAADAAKK